MAGASAIFCNDWTGPLSRPIGSVFSRCRSWYRGYRVPPRCYVRSGSRSVSSVHFPFPGRVCALLVFSLFLSYCSRTLLLAYDSRARGTYLRASFAFLWLVSREVLGRKWLKLACVSSCIVFGCKRKKECRNDGYSLLETIVFW